MTKVSFQEGLRTIESNAFAHCVKLEKVDIPRTLEMAGMCAFHKCSSLQDVNIEEGSLSLIGERAFDGCVKLQTITIPSTVARIKSHTFSCCDSLGVIKFQNGLKYVSDYAFYSCKNLQSVALPEQ